MCQVMKVSRTGYYRYILKEPSNKDEELINKIIEIFNKHKKRYGSRRIKKELENEGIIVSKKKVRRIMDEYGLKPVQSRAYKATTNSKHKYPVAENLIKNLKITRRNQVWVSDITYIGTEEGWLYLATVLDLYTRELVGFSMSNRIDTDLVIVALESAIGKHKPKELIIHSDRGSQYASYRYQAKLKENNITCSMSAKGNPYDNANMESFNSTIKRELIYPRDRKYITREIAKTEIFEYIEIYYNKERLHSAIGYVTPYEYRLGIAV